jgi:hypothetical protein
LIDRQTALQSGARSAWIACNLISPQFDARPRASTASAIVPETNGCAVLHMQVLSRADRHGYRDVADLRRMRPIVRSQTETKMVVSR